MNKLITVSIAVFISFPIFSKEKYSCDDAIPYCKSMQSCEQAKFYLNQCGANRLDRDGDGVPCENVCGKGGKRR